MQFLPSVRVQKVLILCSTYRIAKYVMKIKITIIVILMISDLYICFIWTCSCHF